MQAEPPYAAGPPWRGSADAYATLLANAGAEFHPDELRHGWLAVDRDHRPTPERVGTQTASFRMTTANGRRIVECFLARPSAKLREHCLRLTRLDAENVLPPEVLVPRWYDDGLSLGTTTIPVLVHTEPSGPTLAERLPFLAPAEIADLLHRWTTLRDDLARTFGLRHRGAAPELVFLPGPGVLKIRVAGWEHPPPPGPVEDRLAEALERLLPPPAAEPSPPKPRPRDRRLTLVAMAAALVLCIGALVALVVVA
ncbi:hypothetical protein [Dactylosporangium sp. CA-139066]|uniref:hypothetical protein n=1 Tax=Dactylosporangium sp. CA-139066 TaxID=3239930 RepID=UPI003D94F01B